MTTFFSLIGMLAAIIAVGAIEGPTGHEMNNWWLTFTMIPVMLVSFYLAIIYQINE